jgi:hypothetical protein
MDDEKTLTEGHTIGGTCSTCGTPLLIGEPHGAEVEVQRDVIAISHGDSVEIVSDLRTRFVGEPDPPPKLPQVAVVVRKDARRFCSPECVFAAMVDDAR